MKINRCTVWQMTDEGMHIVDQDSFEYAGPVTQCFGKSKSSTSQETTNVQDIDTTTISLDDIAGVGVAGVGGDVDIVVSDQEAIQAGRDIALSALDANVGVTDRAFDFGEDALDFGGGIAKQATDTLGSAISKVAAATRSDASQTIETIVKFGAIAAGVLGLAFIVTRGKA